MKQDDRKTAKDNFNKDSTDKEAVDNSVNKLNAKNQHTKKPVIHNVVMDTSKKSTTSSSSPSSTDTGLSDSQAKNVPQSTKRVNRRRFMQGFGSLGVTAVGAASLGLTGCDDDNDFNTVVTGDAISFNHGVASGDPLSDQVILWTRVTPQRAGSQRFDVKWVVAHDQQMRDVIKRGEVTTSAVKDYTVKVDVDGLKPNTTYYYQFAVNDQFSRVGKTKTLPVGQVEQVKMAVFSCANYPAGFFHAYADAAKRNDLDVFIHLGDYIYEYARTTTDATGNTIPAYASQNAAAINREVEPAEEAVELNEYRTRYAQYRTDPDLQALHAAVPMIAVWDDHELANDTYEDGAENHQPATEGSWDKRKMAAITAYHEWMPIRHEVQSMIYRSFDFGNLLSLHMLDTRVIGRDEQLNYVNFIRQNNTVGAYIDADAFMEASNDSSRELLGVTQNNWLFDQMQQSDAKWQVLGQQVLMGRMEIPASVILNLADPRLGLDINEYLALTQKAQTAPQTLTPKEQELLQQPAIPYNTDAWDGYAGARERVLATAKSLNKNLVVLAGDTHNAWANNLTDKDGEAVGVEFATSSVSSPGFEEYIPNPPAQVKAVLTQLINGLKFINPNERGYMAITVTPESCQSEWIFVSDILKETYSSEVGQKLKVLAGENKIYEESQPLG